MLTIQPNRRKKPLLSLFDGQMLIDVEFVIPEESFEDNVSISFTEECPPEAQLLAHDAISINLTSAQARTLAQALLAAAEKNDQWLAQ